MLLEELPDFDVKRFIISLTRSACVEDAVNVMITSNVGAIPIIEDDQLIGIFTERDLASRVITEKRDIKSTSLGEVMTSSPRTVTGKKAAKEAIKDMIEGRYRHLLVVDDDGQLINVFSQRDFIFRNWLHLLYREYVESFNASFLIQDVLNILGNRPLVTLSTDANACDAAKLIHSHSIGAAPVLDRGKLLGIFTERDLVMRVIGQRIDADAIPIVDIMTRKMEITTPNICVQDAIDKMSEGKYRHLLVMDEKRDRLIAVLSLRDFMSIAASSNRGEPTHS